MSLLGSRSVVVALIALGTAPWSALAQEPDAPVLPTDRAPHLVVAHPGPHAPVTALAFAPDGKTLYVAGFDKQVRRYQLVDGQWKANGAFRVPIGPGNAGVVNALAVSPDGRWVAAAGRAPMRGETSSGGVDRVSTNLSQLSPLLRRDAGVVYLFNPDKADGGRVLRGQESEVRGLAFAQRLPAGTNVLITAGIEWDAKGTEFGAVRAFRITEKAETMLGVHGELPPTIIPPGLAAWATGANGDGLRVAVAWDANDRKPGRLLLWDNPGADAKKTTWFADAVFNGPLAARGAQIVTGGYDLQQRGGALIVRDATGERKSAVPLPVGTGEAALPLRIAALDVKDAGPATAVFARVLVPDAAPRHELQLRTKDWAKPVVLDGVDPGRLNVLTASPDGRFLAVAGFADNRVEVYDAKAVADGKPQAAKLAGGAAGFSRVRFLTGERLWLGTGADSVANGGVILDLEKDTRRAVPNAPKEKAEVDEPKGAPVPTVSRVNGAPRVSVTLAGVECSVDLPPGETVTAAALLPSDVAWDKNLGPVLAVAHVDTRDRSVRVTLFDPVTKRALMRLAGPTLPVRSLAFSGSRPLLAGAGDDGTVAVWSMKNAARALPTVTGLFLVERGGAVVVDVVEKGGGADGKLARGDVIESVGDVKGVQRPVKTPLDFVLAVRELSVNANAMVKVKGKAAAVAVTVGNATGFRHPLFTLWVDPEPKKGGAHDWVGWTPSGPYDANGATAEGRIGWQTSTGDPARPVLLATADQYRKLYYKRDFIRSLFETADYKLALDAIPPPAAPVLTLVLGKNTQDIDGLATLREAMATATVELTDTDAVFDADRLRLEWQLTGPGGATPLASVPFRGRRAVLALEGYTWKRGAYRLQAKLFKEGDAAGAAPAIEVARTFGYLPPAPKLALQLDKVALAPGAEHRTENEEVEVSVAVDARANPDGAEVALSWTGAAKPVSMTRNADGTFAPMKVKLPAGATTTIMAAATNRGEGVRRDLESRSVEVFARRPLPKEVAPPTVQLTVVTPFDNRLTTDALHIVSAPTVLVQARVTGANPIAAYDWTVGGADPVAGKLDATGTEVREIALPLDGKSLKIQVRAKFANSAFAPAAVEVRYDGLPEVSVAMPLVVVTTPELKLMGGLRVVSKRDFKIRVLVKSKQSGRVREFEPRPNDALTAWDAGVTLFPGVNELGYVVRYDADRKELRKTELVEVRYVRPPVVAASSELDIGTGNVGAVDLAVFAPADAPPNELWANGNRTDLRVRPTPFFLVGVELWLVRADGIGARVGADRLKPVPVVVNNADGTSNGLNVSVVAKEDAKGAPPALRLTHNRGPILPDQRALEVGDAAFRFDLEIVSETPLATLEVWHAVNGGRGELIGTAKPTDAVGAPGRFVLSAPISARLRPGAGNRIRVVAANQSGPSETAFQISYTPPPVTVVIDRIKEPNGAPLVLSELRAAPRVASQWVDVEGRVELIHADDPVATDDNLEVVFLANGVAHLPVPVAKRAAPGARERKFTGRVYLNALDPDPTKLSGDTTIRVVLRSGGLPMAVPQSESAQKPLTVTSTNPLRARRLHVVVLGVEVPQAKRRELVQRVVRAAGGSVPANDPHFTEGPFDRPGFRSAYLYTPSLGTTNSGHLNALLNAVHTDIRDRTRRPGEEWVNDVILIYYEGADWMDASGWFLYSAATKYAPKAANRADKAIRLDSLPQTPGLPILLANVEGKPASGVPLTVDLAALRYAWSDAKGLDDLLVRYAKAIREERTLNAVAVSVANALEALPTKPAAYPTEAPESASALAVGVPAQQP